mgnify:CR=1 FL=1
MSNYSWLTDSVKITQTTYCEYLIALILFCYFVGKVDITKELRIWLNLAARDAGPAWFWKNNFPIFMYDIDFG